jgi:hypothetical protein
MLEHIDSWFSFARGLGLGIDHMEEIILVTGCHHTRTWANIVFLENQTRAETSFGFKATQARGREANDQSINLKWEFPLGSAQGAVCSQGPEGNLNVCHFERDIDFRKSDIALTRFHARQDLQEDQCIFIRGFRVVRRLGIFPKQLRGAAGHNLSLDDDHDNEPDKELRSIPAITKVKHSFCHSSVLVSELSKTRDPLHVLLDHIVRVSGGLPLPGLFIHPDVHCSGHLTATWPSFTTMIWRVLRDCVTVAYVNVISSAQFCCSDLHHHRKPSNPRH